MTEATKPDLKTASTWTEEVTFVDCPECEETIELGTDVVIANGEMLYCEHCRRAFLVEETP